MYVKRFQYSICIRSKKNKNQYRNLFLFLINTLLLYPSLSPYGQTDGRTDRESNTLALRGLEEPAHALRGLEEPFFQLCCCVSFWFWREIGFGFTSYYVLGVPYSCGVVLVFLVLAGNSFGCYIRVVLLCQFLVLAGNSQFFCCGGNVLLRPEKKSSSCLSGGLCCCVSFWFWQL